MKISPIASNFKLKNNINFKAEVKILPSAAKDNQPETDRVALARETSNIKEILEREFPSKSDNVQIYLEPTGFSGGTGKKDAYLNKLRAYVGYKNPEIARKDIIQRNITPPNDDYVKLEPETITKLQNRDSELMKKIGQKVDIESDATSKEYLKDYLSSFLEDIRYLLKSTLDYGVTEYVKEAPVIGENSSYDTTKYWS